MPIVIEQVFDAVKRRSCKVGVGFGDEGSDLLRERRLLPLDEWRVRGRRVYNTASPGTGRLAVRQRAGAAVESNVANLAYLHGDHPSLRFRAGLGSVSVATAGSDGSPIGPRLHDMPFGDVRGAPASGLPTDRRFAGEMRTYMDGPEGENRQLTIVPTGTPPCRRL